ncbi:MAG: carbon storage regulator CsrA [Christensenellales bacterium]
MLVLSRKTGEGITLNQDVVIEILSIEGDRVKIGIKAPKEMRIFRKELLDETVDLNRAAAKTPAISFSR